MTAEQQLTPFPDGVGYCDIAWSSLTGTQREALMSEDAGRVLYRSVLLGVLRRFELLEQDSVRRTDRGQALVEWVTERGLWTI